MAIEKTADRGQLIRFGVTFLLVLAVSWFLFRSDRSPLLAPLGDTTFGRRRLLSFLGAEYLASVLSSSVTLIGGAYALTVLGPAATAPYVTACSLVILVEGALASQPEAGSTPTSGSVSKSCQPRCWTAWPIAAESASSISAVRRR